jgi:hypothetical protein
VTAVLNKYWETSIREFRNDDLCAGLALRNGTAMAHYFFDIEENGRVIRDEEGSPCDDENEMRGLAIATTCSMAHELLRSGNPCHLVINVRSERDRLLRVTLSMDIDPIA